ncbi:MAG TPA: hypothetical protein VFA99_17755 [Acidobacteriaceae bacterium]|nr:hypothetical protein [Acidobacteriaceae bacterium]
MEPIKNLFGQRRPVKPRRVTERGELLEYFLERVNASRRGTKYRPVTIRYIAMKVTAVPTKDLYALKSKMEDGLRRGMSASMIFFSELKPQTYANQ